MKMIYAGLASSPNAVAEKWLYNCTRNNCQKPYFIPIIDFTDFVLYFDFPGKPSAYTISIVPCDGSEPIAITGLFCNYVIAQKPDNSWYGIFTQLATDSFPILTRFYIAATFTVNGTDYKYFSNQYEFDLCAVITKIDGCYNDIALGGNAYDCNGVYYGYHAGTDIALGNVQLRYFHHAYIRDAEVIETDNKMAFTLFYSRRAYRNNFTRLYTFQFEPVPGFYKDEIIGVLIRGNIGIDNVEYILAEAQDFGLVNDSLKWWKLDVKLSSLCRQWFSCTPTTCVPVLPLCINDFDTAAYVPDDGGGYIHLSGGILATGDSITWTLISGDAVVESGTSTSVDIHFVTVLNPDLYCYQFTWFKNCACGGTSEDGGGDTGYFFRYGYSATEIADGTGGTLDKTTFNYQYVGVYVPGQPLNTQFVAMPNNRFIAIEYPDTESDKITWVNRAGSNYGTIPDTIMNTIVATGGKKYITSRIEMTLDNNFTTVFT